MISVAPRLHRLPSLLVLTAVTGALLSSCSSFGSKQPTAAQTPPPAHAPHVRNNNPSQMASAPRAAKTAKTNTIAGQEAPGTYTPVPSGPAPANADSSGLSSMVPSNTPLSVSSVPVSGKYIAMTFDDGPSSAYTRKLLGILRQRHIKATFFCVGENVDANPAIAKEIVAEGHEIGNHSYSHPLLTKLGEDAFESQMSRTHDAIVRATGVTPTLCRPPYGAASPSQKEWLASKYNYHLIMWSVDPLDWKNRNSTTVRTRILAQTKPGAIILSHDIHGTTVDAMPSTLDELLRRGYHFVTVSQLLAMRSASTGG